MHHNQKGYDVFPTEEEAKKFISASRKILLTTLATFEKALLTIITRSAHALLGYVVLDGEASLLLATQIKETLHLPGYSPTFTILETRIVTVELANVDRIQPSLDVQKHREKLLQFPLAGNHYFSEGSDISHPFPYFESEQVYD